MPLEHFGNLQTDIISQSYAVEENVKQNSYNATNKQYVFVHSPKRLKASALYKVILHEKVYRDNTNV